MAVTASYQIYDGEFNAAAIAVAILMALSLYNALELALTIFLTFKKRSGLYFWSLVLATAGVLAYSLGMTVWYYRKAPSYIGLVINNVGWIVMVVGQSFVLYSRLHLVLTQTHQLNAIFWMIIVVGAVTYIPATIIQFGSFAKIYYDAFQRASHIFEPIQMTAFSAQEIIISGLYLKEIFRLSKTTFNIQKQDSIGKLVLVHVIIIGLDLALLILEYMGLAIYQQSFKSVCYSIKLKMEFAVLGKLIASVSKTSNVYIMDSGRDNRLSRPGGCPNTPNSLRRCYTQDGEQSDSLALTKTNSNVRQTHVEQFQFADEISIRSLSESQPAHLKNSGIYFSQAHMPDAAQFSFFPRD